MADLSIRLAVSDINHNNLTPFYIVVKQNNSIILSAWSTTPYINSDPQLLNKLTGNYNNTIPVTIELYNLGKKVNNVKADIIHYYIEAGQSSGGNTVDIASGTKGELSFTCPTSSEFYGTWVRIYNHEANQTNSGVNYRAAGTNIESFKASDSSFISTLTPNIATNPNYIVAAGLVAPTVSATTILSTDSLTISGMIAGDILRFLVNGVRQENDNIIIQSTGLIVIPMSGYIGSVYFYYVRSGVSSPNSETVTVTENASQLPILTVINTLSLPKNYVGEKVNVTGFTSGASLLITLGNGTISSTVGTDYNISNISGGGFQVTFLRADIFHFRQTKPSFLTSPDLFTNVEATRPILPIPILSIYTATVGGNTIVTNQSTVEYSNINIYKDGNLVIESEGNHTVSGSTYTFLRVGRYKFIGQKANIADSTFSNEVVVTSSTTTPTPILEIVNGDQFACINLNNGSITTKTIEVWKDGIAQTPLITTQGTGYSFQNVLPSKYKIRYKVGLKDYSEFSNEIDLRAVSFTPTIVSWDGTLTGLGISTFIGTGVAGSTISIYKNDNINALSTVAVNNSGAWTYIALTSGHYKFAQITINKTISSFTANYTVSEIAPPLNKSETPTIETTAPISAGESISGFCSLVGELGIWRGYNAGSTPNYTIQVTDGTWIWTSLFNDYGDYQFTFTETGKDISDPTLPVFSVVRQRSAPPIITNTTPLNLPNVLSGIAPNNSIVKIYKQLVLIDSFTIETTAIHLNGVWSWNIANPGTYQITITESNKSESIKSDNVDVIESCGDLHIRTPTTDQTLFPNTITEEIDDIGIRIGIIPQTTRTNITSYLVTATFLSEIPFITVSVELVSLTIPYPIKNNYLYFSIPKIKCPPVGSIITIFIKAISVLGEQSFPCITSTTHTIKSIPILKSNSCLAIQSIEAIENSNRLKLTLLRS